MRWLVLLSLVVGITVGFGICRFWFTSRPVVSSATLDSQTPGTPQTPPADAPRPANPENAIPMVAPSVVQSPGAMIEELRRLSVLDEEILGAIARTWSQTDPRAALAWVASLPAKDTQRAMRGFLFDTRRLGIEEVFHFVNLITNEMVRASVASLISERLVHENFSEAMAFAQRFPEPLREQAMRPILASLAETQPLAALQQIASMEPGKARTELLQRAVASWAVKDRDAALAWVRQLSPGAERDEVLASSLGNLGPSDPPRALELLAMIEQSGPRQRVVENVAAAWAKTDPAAAATWLHGLTNSAEQAAGGKSLGREWAFTDSKATLTWLSSLPAGPARDAAIDGFISWADGYDPARATVWASTMEDQDLRESRVRYTFGRWLEHDAVEAKAWLGNANISATLRAELLRLGESAGNRGR